MTKSKQCNHVLLNKLLYAYITGTIESPSEWTTVARFFNLPHYFSGRRASPHLIAGLAEEIFYHMNKNPPTLVGFRLWEFTRSFSEFLSDEQQQSFKSFLLNLPFSMEE